MKKNKLKRSRFTISILAGGLILLLTMLRGNAQIRDSGIDPKNLGKGVWVYSMVDATNKLGGHIPSVTNEDSLMKFYRSAGIRYFMVKVGTSDKFFTDCYGTPQLTTNLVNTAHQNGILVFGYNRSYGVNIVGEVAIANYVFNTGADGFVFDAEAEWETSTNSPWITNGSAQAWQLCSTVRSNWPNKFIAHAPFPIIYLHSTFPYKEFGYWCDAVMPQIYHFSSTGIKGSPSAAINWSDVNWKTFQASLRSMANSNINGTIVVWTNAIKPIIPLQDVYGNVVSGGIICETPAGTVYPDEDVMEFADYSAADPNAQTVGGYKGANYWRADTIGSNQWNNISSSTIGGYSNVVNNFVFDDPSGTVTGAWTAVRVFGATTTTPTYYGATGSDTNSFGTNYLSKAQGNGNASVRFTPNIIIPGNYDVYQWHPYVTNASAGTPFYITHAAGTTVVYANQQTNSGNWSWLGRFYFNPGTNGSISVLDNFSDAGNLAIVDGLKLVYANADVILDNTNAEVVFNGPWSIGNSAAGRYQADYAFAANSVSVTATADYRPNLPNPGFYNVYLWYPSSSNRATNAPWTINYLGGSTNAIVNQQINGGSWQLIAASRPFAAGTNGFVRLANNASASVVIADAVRFSFQAPLVQPGFTAVTRQTNGSIRLNTSGTPGYPFWIDYSTNLLQWQVLTNTVLNTVSNTFIDPNATTNQTGFYRARQ